VWTSLSNAFRLLAMLYRAGIPLLESLGHAAAAAQNQGVRDELVELRTRVEGGRTLARSASDPPLFNRFCRAMIDTGEQTGALDTQLDRVSTKYDQSLDHLYARIEAVFTPAVTIVLIAIVGYVLVALYMPFVALIEKLSQPR
jgi:type IV pilus assembly protein PilC